MFKASPRLLAACLILSASLVAQHRVERGGFRRTESGAVEMNAGTRKEVLVAYQKRKQEEIVHPYLKKKVSFGLTPHVQTMLLARHLRGELDGYPSFLWR